MFSTEFAFCFFIYYPYICTWVYVHKTKFEKKKVLRGTITRSEMGKQKLHVQAKNVFFEKGCQKKCTRQSRKVSWVVLNSLLFKEIWKNRTRGHGNMFASVKGKQQKEVRYLQSSSGTVYWSYPILVHTKTVDFFLRPLIGYSKSGYPVLFTDWPPAPPNERRQTRIGYEQNGFPLCCRNKERNFTNNQTSCSRNTQRRWRNSVRKFLQLIAVLCIHPDF